MNEVRRMNRRGLVGYKHVKEGIKEEKEEEAEEEKD